MKRIFCGLGGATVLSEPGKFIPGEQRNLDGRKETKTETSKDFQSRPRGAEWKKWVKTVRNIFC